MRLANVLIPVLLVGAVGAAYAAGHYVGSYDTEQRFRAGLAGIEGQQSVSTLFVLNRAIDSLEQAKPEDAHKVLVRYARLQVPNVVECAKTPLCATFAGRMLQSPTELAKVKARDELLPLDRR